MSFSRRAIVAVAAVIATLGLAVSLSACGVPVSDEAAPTQTRTPQAHRPTPTSTPQSTPDEVESDEPQGEPDVDEVGTRRADTDGGNDPAQDTVRTGPVAQYGGPAYGDQGAAEVIDTGVWCKTIAVFWGGGDPIPDGVRFTFLTGVPDRPGLAVQGGVCGSAGADRSCLGMTVEANQSGIFCSIVVLPAADFVDGTTVSFTGKLECPTSDVCDAVAARQVAPGPPIVINTPAGA